MSPERVRQIRQRAGMSQEEFARTFDVSQQTVWRWESGRRAPNQWHVAALEKFEQRLAEAEKENQVREFVAGIAGGAAVFGVGWFLAKLFDEATSSDSSDLNGGS